MNNLHFLGEKIVEKKYEIAHKVHTSRMVDLKQTRNFNLTNEKIIELRANFINNFGEAIMLNLDQNTSFDRILKWGKESGELASNLGVSLSEAL
ncbi:STAS domain-containing protein, partial [Priestia megaterium]|nr:STAS domain-containing protein [Priestia megaterium]